jgi:hypothetical protein
MYIKVNYIVDKLKAQANVDNTPGYSLAIGDKVRLIENKHIMKKTRYNITFFFILLSRLS